MALGSIAVPGWCGLPMVVLAFHDDYENSKGTKNMVELAQNAGITVKLVTGDNMTDEAIDRRTKKER